MKKQNKKISRKENKGISKSMSFSELINKHPESIEVLLENGMHCFGCAMASFETLEQGCVAHGLDANKIIKEINEKINKNKLGGK